MSTIHHLDLSSVRGQMFGSVLQSIRAEGRVQGLLFELSVEQCYRNDSDGNIEAIYTFPVAWNAVLLGVECIIGDKILHGTVIAKADGERRYEDALEEGDAAVMVERASDGMYTVNVGNLLPGERAIIRFRYAQLLSFAQGQVSLVVPTTIGPRYSDPRAVGMKPHQMPTHDVFAGVPFALSIAVHGDLASGILSSPSHALSTHSRDGCVTLSLANGAQLDRDVVVVADGLAGKSITTLARDAEGYVALASFCPDERERARDTALNLKILVDCSGSMNGDRIDAARRALHDVLSHLEPDDNFTFSRFGSDVDHCTTSLMAATPRAIKKASNWIGATQADMGGTEIADALLSTYALAQPFGADILLVTDGDVWEADRLIASATLAGQRIFAVGIGSAPASSLLHALASRTGGACECVAADIEIPGAVLRMFKRMRQAPIRDVEVTWDATPDWQTSGGRVVLSGETVHHMAGFAKHPPTKASLEWIDGANTAHAVSVPIDGVTVDGSTLARVAGAIRMPDLAPAERHQIALRYGLVSPTTNLILVHERSDANKPDQLPALHQVPHAIPAGWGGLGTVRQGKYNGFDGTLRASTHGASPAGPAVWRRESSSAMLRVSGRHETYDIPAFLRKQAPNKDARYRDVLRRFAASMAAAKSMAPQTMPTSLRDIAAELPKELIDELHALIDEGFKEADVVSAFVDVVVKQFRADGLTRRVVNALQRWGAKRNATSPVLEQRVQTMLSDAVGEHQPDSSTQIPAWLIRAAD